MSRAQQQPVFTKKGTLRKPPPRGQHLHAYEIEVGRAVPNNWDKELFESWEDRKARLARERGQR